MVIIDLILCLAAIIFAIIAAIKKYRKFNVLVVLSYVCYSLAILYSLYDMITRVNSNDIAGILDIYPIMIIGYLIVIVTVLNLYAVLKRRNTIDFSLLK